MGTIIKNTWYNVKISKLFGVTVDYLLNDEYKSDNDVPKIKEVKNNNIRQLMIILVTLEIMNLIFMHATAIILQNTFWGILSYLPFVAIVGFF